MKPADISMRPADWRLASIDFSAAKQLVAEQPSSSAPDKEGYAALARLRAYHVPKGIHELQRPTFPLTGLPESNGRRMRKNYE